MTTKRDYEEVASRELKMYPVTFSFEHHRRHPYIEVKSVDGASLFSITYPSTCSDQRGIWNFRAELRRHLRSNGIKANSWCKPDKIGDLGEIMAETAAKSFTEAFANRIAVDEKPSVDEAPAVSAVPEATNDDGPKRVCFLNSEIAVITRLVIQHASYDASRSFAWHDGWSDQCVAAILAAAPGRDVITERHVQKCRSDLFGDTAEEKIRQRSPARRAGSIEDQLADIRRRLDALEDLATRAG